MIRAIHRLRTPVSSTAPLLAAAILCLWSAPAWSQSRIATPGTSGDQLLFVYDATEGRVPFLVVSNLASEALTVEVAWYAQGAGTRLATQILTVLGGGNSIFDPSQVVGVEGNAGITVVTPIRSEDDSTPVVPPSPQGTSTGPLFGGFTLADLATNGGFGQNPLARLAVDTGGRRAAAGSVVDGTTVRYQTFAPDMLVLPFYFNPGSEGLTNRVILGTFTDQYAGGRFSIGSAETVFSHAMLDSDGDSFFKVKAPVVTGVLFDTVESLASQLPLTTSGKVVFFDLAASDQPNRNVFGLMTQALGTFSVGQRMPGAFTSPAERWTDNGDGTATDNTTGLVWELKTDDDSIHDKDDLYAWSTGFTSKPWGPDGTAFVDFLGTLNGGESDGVTTTGCFAGKCDWRLATIEELVGIVDLSAPGCGGGSPCTTIPGETVSSFYWSSSTVAVVPGGAWGVGFNGLVDSENKNFNSHVRAVRGGS